jgi:hypothetical protein
MRNCAILIAVCLGMGLCQNADATTIYYSVSYLGSNSYEYTYTVDNDTSAASIQEFTIWFDEQYYGNIQIMTAAPLSNNWDEILLASTGFGIPLGYDALSNGSGILPGETAAGFKVKFNWLGAGLQGVQKYEIINPLGSTTIESGYTVRYPVPEPITVLLAGMGWLFTRGRRAQM